jgi:hypothetical protein
MRRIGVYARTCRWLGAMKFLSEIGEEPGEVWVRLRGRTYLPRVGGNLQPLWDLVLYEMGVSPPRYRVPALFGERRG